MFVAVKPVMHLLRRHINFDAWQEQSSEELKAFLDKFGTLRTVESGESTPDALFGKMNSVVLAMIQEVNVSTRALSMTSPLTHIWLTHGRAE